MCERELERHRERLEERERERGILMIFPNNHSYIQDPESYVA